MQLNVYVRYFLLIIFCFAFTHSIGQNLIVNGDFSQGGMGWDPIGSPYIVDVQTVGGPPQTGNNAWHVTFSSKVQQSVEVQPNTAYVLRFKATRNNKNDIFGTLLAPAQTPLVTIVSDGTDTFINNLKNYTQATNPQPFTMTQELYYFITGPSTDTVTLLFTVPTSSSNWENTVIDDVELISTSVCSGMPSGGTVIPSMPAVCPGIPFTVNLDSFTMGPGITLEWQSSPAGMNNWTAAGSTNGNLELTGGITAATDYRCKVTCTGSGQSVFSGVATVTIKAALDCYCIPVNWYACGTYGAYIENLYLQGESGSAINTINSGCTPYNYDDRTGIDSVKLALGNTYVIHLSGALYVGYPIAWIDYGDDGAFDPADTVGLFGGYSSSNVIAMMGQLQPQFFQIYIPANAPLGIHRMRVRDVVNTTTPFNMACSANMGGESHDYTVQIINPVTTVPCVSPSLPLPVLPSITAHTAEVGWSQVGSVSQWQIEYGPVGFAMGTGSSGFMPGTGVGTTVVVNTNPAVLTGLTSDTHYWYYVRAICGPGDTTVWSMPGVFTTAISCFQSTNYPPTSVTTNSATLTWTPQPGVTDWQIRYSIYGGPVTIVDVNTIPYTLTGLNPGTQYYWSVRSICAPGDTSAWSYESLYTAINTVVSCPKPTNYVVTNITANSADIAWTQSGTPIEWQISYGTNNFSTPASGTISSTTNNPHTLTGLDPGTYYKFYVRAICGPGDTSAWATGVFNNNVIITTCEPVTTPYIQNFDMTTPGLFPLCMSKTGGANSILWGTINNPSIYSSLQPHSGNRYVIMSANNQDTAYTGGIDLIGGETYYFKCYYITDGASGWSSLSAIVDTDQDPSAYLQSIVTVNDPVNTSYVPLSGSFTPASSGTYYFGVAYSGQSPANFLSFDDITVTTSPLAIRLASLEAAAVGQYNKVGWKTAMEVPGDVIDLEYSTDGWDFSFLERFEATGVAKDYSYLHRTPAEGVNYYRLKLKDAQGNYSYSKTVTALQQSNTAAMEVTPNPATDRITVKVPGWKPGARLILKDVYGREVKHADMEKERTEIYIGDLPAGSYLLTYPATGGKAIKVIKL